MNVSNPTATAHQKPAPAYPPRCRLLTMEEAAARLGLSPSTLYSWHHQGTYLAFIKIGRRVMVDPNDIERFIEANKKQPRDLGSFGVTDGRP